MESNQWFGSHNNAHQNQSQSGSYKNLVKPELRSNKNQFSTEIFLQHIKRGQALIKAVYVKNNFLRHLLEIAFSHVSTNYKKC